MRHSPRLRGLNHPADMARAPVTTPAPAVLPRLALSFLGSVTLAGPAESRARMHVRREPGSHPVTFCGSTWTRFLEVEYRSSSLPARTSSLSRFGTVSDPTDQQGLDARFIVELFTDRPFLAAHRETSTAPGSACRHAGGSRRWRMFHEPHGLFTRLALTQQGFGPESHPGDWCPSARTHFEQHGLSRANLAIRAGPSLSRSPVFRHGSYMG